MPRTRKVTASSIRRVQQQLRERTKREQQRNSRRIFQEANRLKRLPLYLFTILDELKAQAVARGVDVIDLGMGNPDLPPPQHVVDELVRQAKRPENHRYSRKNGDVETTLNETIAQWYQRKFLKNRIFWHSNLPSVIKQHLLEFELIIVPHVFHIWHIIMGPICLSG